MSLTNAKYYAKMNAITVTDTGDFLQIRGGASRKATIKEIRVSQTGKTSLVMTAIGFRRGTTGGAAGSALTTYKNDLAVQAAVATCHSLPTTDVTTLDMDMIFGWNNLQEFVWMPPPEFQLEVSAAQDLGIYLAIDNATDDTMNCSVWWDEEGV